MRRSSTQPVGGHRGLRRRGGGRRPTANWGGMAVLPSASGTDRHEPTTLDTWCLGATRYLHVLSLHGPVRAGTDGGGAMLEPAGPAERTGRLPRTWPRSQHGAGCGRGRTASAWSVKRAAGHPTAGASDRHAELRAGLVRRRVWGPPDETRRNTIGFTKELAFPRSGPRRGGVDQRSGCQPVHRRRGHPPARAPLPAAADSVAQTAFELSSWPH